jgi:lysozyme
MSDDGLKQLIRAEGVRYQVYDDRNGQIISSYDQAIGFPTIGVGHLIYRPGAVDQRSRFEKYLGGRQSMTEKQVMDLLREDLPKYEDPVSAKIQKPVTPQMFDALVSLAFNAGPNARAVKNAIEAINREDYQGASDAIRNGPQTSDGKLLQGLVKRRNEEADWFLSGGLPTGIRLFGTNIRILPYLALGSFALLGFALYLKRR